MRVRLFAAAVALVGLGVATAQPPATPTTPPSSTTPSTLPTPAPQTQPLGTVPQQPGAATEQPTLRARSVLGARVSVQNNTAVGVIDDLVFDADGQIEYAIVAERNQLVTVPWQAVKFQAAAQANQPGTAVIAIPAEQFRVIPRYSVTTYPSFYTPAYRTEVYRYYGLTPRERRMLDRRLP